MNETENILEVQGHRGARGLAPENTLAAFSRAMELGVDVLELDCVLSKDGDVMVHHDIRLNPEITRIDNAWISNEEGPALKTLSTKEVQIFDVGSIKPNSSYASRFPNRKSSRASIPLLKDVFALVASQGSSSLQFNIETKFDPEQIEDSPDPKMLVRKISSLIEEFKLTNRVTIQSFAWETLAQLDEINPAIKTSCLTFEKDDDDTIWRGRGISPWTRRDVEAFGGSVPKMVKDAGCQIWSPYHRDLDSKQIAEAHALGLRIAVWTVNEKSDFEHVVELGVDSIITDYPDRVLRWLER